MPISGKERIRCYKTWTSMLERCYSGQSLQTNPSYIGCSVCLDWLTYSNFADWYVANAVDGYHLDKDILVPGNRVYGPDTCVFVPRRINTFLTHVKRTNGTLPIGITVRVQVTSAGNDSISYCARVCDGRGDKYRHKQQRYFPTLEQAVTYYRETKHKTACTIALEAFLANEIKSDVYLALVRRRFE